MVDVKKPHRKRWNCRFECLINDEGWYLKHGNVPLRKLEVT